MSDARFLSDIADEMESLTDDDPEASHSRADELLIEAIERLAPYATDTGDEGDQERVIAAWKSLKKWYA